MTQESANDITKRLNEEGRQKSLPSRFLKFYAGLFDIQSRIEQQITIPQPALSKDIAKERLEDGLPLLKFEELVLDWPLFQNTFAEITSLFANFPDLFGELPKNLGKLSIEVVKARFDDTDLPTVTPDINTNLMEAILDTTLKPFLVSHGKALINLVDHEGWRRRYCPVCGGKPDFAFLAKERGARWLVCSRCDSQWLFQRLECPYCGTQDQNALSFFTDAEGLYRLYVCDHCHTYIKAIDSKKTQSKILPPVERVLTLDMDHQATEKGYKPGYAKNR